MKNNSTLDSFFTKEEQKERERLDRIYKERILKEEQNLKEQEEQINQPEEEKKE